MIEWFLSPRTEQERSIQYAMQLFGAGKATDQALERYLDKDDRELDRRLKQLQGRKLAAEQGLDWKDYTSDDALDHNLGTAAVRYGLDKSHDAKMPWIPVMAQKSNKMQEAIQTAKQALGFQWDANAKAAESIADLMKAAGKGIKVARYL